MLWALCVSLGFIKNMEVGKNSPMEECPSCRGKGKVECPFCKGKGRPFDCSHCGDIANSYDWGVVVCDRCAGAGKIKCV